jgi:tRNA pseudouridine55 synthase
VTCGAGTYIRSLAHDLGAVLEVGAHLTALTRTRSGSFDLAQAHPLDAVLAAPDWAHLLVELRAGLSDWPVVSLESAQLDHILHGRAIPAQAPHPTDSLALGLDSAGELRAVLRMTDDGRWQPHKVFPLAE